MLVVVFVAVVVSVNKTDFFEGTILPVQYIIICSANLPLRPRPVTLGLVKVGTPLRYEELLLHPAFGTKGTTTILDTYCSE